MHMGVGAPAGGAGMPPAMTLGGGSLFASSFGAGAAAAEAAAAAAGEAAAAAAAAARENAAAHLTPAGKRRAAVVRYLMEDAPGVEYNRRFTHTVGGKVITRRPALLSAALRPTPYRVDNRPDLGGLQLATADDMERLAIGVARNEFVGALRRAALGLATGGPEGTP